MSTETTDAMVRNPETGQFESATAREIAEQYLADEYDTELSELISAYEQVNDTFRGRVAFP